MSIINTSNGTLTEEKTKIQKAIGCIDKVLNSLFDEIIEYQLTTDDIDWLERAKQVLEKQIPKKPVRKEEFGKFYCPVCSKRLLFLKDKYCSCCGQAIDCNVVFMSEDECRELILKKFPEYTIGRIIDYGDWYEVIIWKPKSWGHKVFSVQKNNGYIRELGV